MQEYIIDKISSLSGLVEFENLLFTVSDEYYSIVVTDLQKQKKIDFNALKNQNLLTLSYAERKKIKPDFESISVFSYNKQSFIHILPSFSKVNRCEGYLLELDNKKSDLDVISSFQEINYHSMYQDLIKNDLELNIEGHLFLDTKLLLFNRGNLNSKNQLLYLEYDFSIFSGRLQNVIDVDLGMYKGYPIQWTDALWKSSVEIYFSATVEKVQNAFDDGQILASFIGEYNLRDNKVTKLVKLLDNEKIEGLSFIKGDMAICIDPDNQGSHGKIFYGIKL